MSLSRRADPIRLIAVRLGQGELKNETSKPGVNEALRISIQYHDGRHPNSVATVRRRHGDACELTVAYDKDKLSYDFALPVERYQKMLIALRASKFDTLDDEENLPYFGIDMWLVERASGSFYHDIVLSPDHATGHHREIIVATRQHLPEAVRELAL